MPIPPRFKECRLRAGLTQQEAAAKLGRTASAIQKWEQGMNSPTMDDIHRLAEVYQVKPSLFFEEDGPTENETGITLVLSGGGIRSTADRQRIMGYLRECAEVFPVLPEGFSVHWIESLKVAAATLGDQTVGRANRRRRRK